MPFTAFDETGIVGFFTLRNPDESLDELRFGFVILNPDKWGKGYGKEMLRLGLKFVFETYCVLGEKWKCKELVMMGNKEK